MTKPTTKRCSICRVLKPVSEFHKKTLSKSGIKSACKECDLAMQKRRRDPKKCRENSLRWKNKIISKSPEHFLWFRMKWNAKAKGIKFNIKPEDLKIPEFCEVLGIKLLVFSPNSNGRRAPHPRSASIDRLDSSKGYVRGNVKVISHLANLIKNIGTVEQHKRVIAYMEKHGLK